MKWEKLVSNKTQIARDTEARAWADYPISDFEKDYKSIISSAAFRRLQDKTQVFPLDQSDFVRTRLTHSVEVSTIAKQLGIMVTKNTTGFLSPDFSANPQLQYDIPSILSCSGLLHDLGNPPFGHFGEVIIGEWFKKKFESEDFLYKGIHIRDLLNEQMKNDLCHFEGNAQALRILSKVRNNPDGYDSNLTYAVINTLIKYPTNSLAADSDSADVRIHKPGYFLSERELFEEIRRESGIGCNGQGDPQARHPLAFLMEAADDIAYATSDLEDAMKKGMFTIDEFINYFQKETESLPNSDKKKKTTELLADLKDRLAVYDERNKAQELIAFQKWTIYVKRWFMYVVAYSFSKNYKEIMEGKYDKDLFEEGYHTYSLKILKNAMKKFVFQSPGILKLELAAKKIITALLDDFIYAVLYWEDEDDIYKLTKAEKKLVNIISENYKQDYLNAYGLDSAYNLYLRFLMVTDYISGMTDSFAKKLYQELNGID